jgi:hypothetical protein
LESTKQRYAVGRWESLWPNEPYMSHRIVLDRVNRTVIAGQDRRIKRWTSMCEDDCAYMQQIIDETYPHVFDEPEEFGLTLTDTLTDWSTAT